MADRTIGIIGGGIVGLATAFKLSEKHPNSHVVLFEKEKGVALHQTGRNSGVVHSGIYYKPGSIKALTCIDGRNQLERQCKELGVAFERCGKVIVALDEHELPRLQSIFERGLEHGLQCQMLDSVALREREPYVAGVEAIYVPETAIVDYPAFCNRLGEVVVSRGHQIRTRTRVIGISERDDGITVKTNDKEIRVEKLVNCAGLYSDQIALMAAQTPDMRIVPFRGEYFELSTSASRLCRNLIYPVPDPSFPFLGVHFTRMIQGGVECGPNAVLAFAREGYTIWTIQPREFAETLNYPGFLRLAKRHWRMGAGEMWRSVNKPAFVKALQRLVPEIQASMLSKSPAGVRAQAVRANGDLVDDFAFVQSPRCIHVLNSPSPAATASLAIADRIAGMIES